MPRIARFVAEGYPHHITQRGNGRQTVFDDPQDRRIYLKLLREHASAHGLSIWAWCLMTNHVHMLLRPSQSKLGHFMRRLLTGHAVSFNLRHHRSGYKQQNNVEDGAEEQ